MPATDDPLGYDTRDPSWVRKAAEDALSGADKDAIGKEVDAALRRWGLRNGSSTSRSVDREEES